MPNNQHDYEIIYEARCRVVYRTSCFVVAYACEVGTTPVGRLICDIHWNQRYCRDDSGKDIRLSWEEELVIRDRIREYFRTENAEVIEDYSQWEKPNGSGVFSPKAGE